MNSFAKARIERAKRTRIGRIVCRLIGEQTGAVLMEYVVLGVLLVAAVVGAVVMFGDDIKGAFKVMGRTIIGGAPAGETAIGKERQALDGREQDADDVSTTFTGRGEGGEEEQEGD